MKICFVLGTRPEIIKLYSSVQYCIKNNIDFFIIHTNQHYSISMDKVFFDELKLPPAKYNLGVNSCGHGEMTGRMLIEIEKIIISEQPDFVFVQGDTNTVLAGSLAASKSDTKLLHIEAGLRSYDKSMPEEINRVCADHISDFLFCPTEKQKDILIGEGIEASKIYTVGNTIVDAVYSVTNGICDGSREAFLDKNRVLESKYIYFSLHRPSNVDSEFNLRNILETLTEIRRKYRLDILFPAHPRTLSNIKKFGLEDLISGFLVKEPFSYFENIAMLQNSFMVVTDSGGIQEEACILRKKTIILRENTERPETLDVGGSLLVGSSKVKIFEGFDTLSSRSVSWYNPFGSGKSSEIIFETIL